MNVTASFPSETSWSRRCSTETVFSVQGKETDFVQDSSDTELGSGDDKDVEYEPATASEQEAAITADSSGQTDMDLMSSGAAPLPPDCTTDGQRASSDAGSASDSELDLPAYWACARCRGTNDNSRYRYCRRCFKIRKDFFPPRPRRKEKRTGGSQDGGLILSQDSGIESLNSQEMKLSQDAGESSAIPDDRLGKALPTKRRADSAEREYKRPRLDSQLDVEGQTVDVAPLVKTNSDPSVTIESLEAYKGYTTDPKDLCIICLTEPKTGVFVHRRVAHICCCYKCAVKVWSKAKRCPICNCKVSNVLKAVVM